MSKYKAGDLIVFGKRKRHKDLLGITIGKIYTVEDDGSGCGPDDLFFFDDDGDERYAPLDKECKDKYKPTLIVGSI